MLTQLRRSAVMVLICLVLFGLVFPLVGVGLSQLFFKHQADGSITANGSTLIGQDWSQTKCPGHLPGSCVFQGRPDALGPYSDVGKYKGDNPAEHPGDDPLVANGQAGESGATNLGPRSKVLVADTRILVKYWLARGVQPTSDLVTTSGSGIVTMLSSKNGGLATEFAGDDLGIGFADPKTGNGADVAENGIADNLRHLR